jgi:PAS domain S-box-containing protein
MDAIVTADGVIDHWNPAAERLYGYTAAEAIGQPATLIVPPDKIDEIEMMQAKLERGERIEQFVTQRLRKDGTLIDVEITVFPVMGEGGKLAATSVISHDLTEQLRLAKEVEQTARLKADFLATMSHEIRTPLSAIIGTAELQMLSDMTPEQSRRMSAIKSSGELLLAIVDDILDFSKLSAGKLAIEKIDFNLADLLESVVDTFAVVVRSRRLELGLFLDPAIPSRLRGDSKRVRQVLNNLLSNAVKFTPTGGISLSIDKIRETDDEVSVCFEVRDQGIGIAPEVQSHLFQPFVQADQSTSRRFGGTGLGLVISAQLAKRMGSTIEIDSAPGKGSTFRLKLGFEKAEHTAEYTRADIMGAELKGIHALVVGDDEISREAIARQLDSWGMETRSIAGDESALGELRLAHTQNRSYSAVLLDEGPAKEGLTLAGLIKTDSTLKDTFVIMMTSDPSMILATETVDRWLTKPSSPSLLFDAVGKLLSNRAQQNSDPVRPVQVRNPPPAWRKDVRVLVVEDNLTNQTLIREQLNVLGYTVDIVSDAASALGAINQSHYDVVLMDCELPGMSGYEATAEIRRHEGNRTPLRIIALTAHVTEDQKKRCLDAGMDGYLRKPASLQILAETLDAGHRNDAGASETFPTRDENAGEELDPAALTAIRELSRATGRNVYRELVDTFLSDLPPRIKLLTTALRSSNMDELASVTHPLKSASAIVGAKRFSNICARVERYAREGKVGPASSFTSELLEAAQSLPNALRGSTNYK